MKSAGLEREHWQQQTGAAIMKRLLVASMALVIVWQLIRLTTPKATTFKDLYSLHLKIQFCNGFYC
jgi:hypothetical protein